MSTVGLSLRQFRFEWRATFRNRASLIFTLAFPVMFLVLFGINAHGHTETFRGKQISTLQFLVPGIMAYGVIGATYTSLCMRLTTQRDQGILKRIAGTPLPRSLYMVGQILNSVALATLISIITLVMAVALYGVHTYAATALAIVVTIVIASASFCAMALAVTSLIPNADAAPGIVQGTIFPVLFISDVFYSVEGANRWLVDFAGLLPVKHFANALQTAFSPNTTGSGFNFTDLAVIAAWGLAAGLFAAKKFRWETKNS